jgi:hypothetical protein
MRHNPVICKRVDHPRGKLLDRTHAGFNPSNIVASANIHEKLQFCHQCCVVISEVTGFIHGKWQFCHQTNPCQPHPYWANPNTAESMVKPEHRANHTRISAIATKQITPPTGTIGRQCTRPFPLLQVRAQHTRTTPSVLCDVISAVTEFMVSYGGPNIPGPRLQCYSVTHDGTG